MTGETSEENPVMTKTLDRRIMIAEMGRIIKRLHYLVKVMLLPIA